MDGKWICLVRAFETMASYAQVALARLAALILHAQGSTASAEYHERGGCIAEVRQHCVTVYVSYRAEEHYWRGLRRWLPDCRDFICNLLRDSLHFIV